MQQVFQCLPEPLWIALGQAIQDMGIQWSDLKPFARSTTARISIGRNCVVEAAGRTFTEGVYVVDAA